VGSLNYKVRRLESFSIFINTLVFKAGTVIILPKGKGVAFISPTLLT